MKSYSVRMVFAAIVAVVGAGQVKADLITNGSFETQAPGTDTTIPAGWTLINPGVDTGRTGTIAGLAAFDGNFFAQLSNFAPGGPSPAGDSGFQQSVSDASGQQYLLSFYYSNSANSDTDNHFKVSWNGHTLMNLVDFARLSDVWQHKTFVVTGTGSDTLSFIGYQNLGRLGVDSVSLNQSSSVPEPSTFALLGLGGIGLAVSGYRRRRAAF